MKRPAVRLTCEGVSKEYTSSAGHTVRALDAISLSIQEGEFMTVVGSSGSGKSTLLRILAGIEAPTAGSISDSRTAEDGRIGFVFQGESVFPWRTVEKNLSYSLEARGAKSGERAKQARELCTLVGLEPDIFLNKYPRELSGGETRRVAIGMALSAGASLLLFDEPTSQLDYVSRVKLQTMVQNLWLQSHPTIVYVTHDIEEAILLGNRIAVLGSGKLREVICVNLPIPRTIEVMEAPEFSALRRRILNELDIAK